MLATDGNGRGKPFPHWTDNWKDLIEFEIVPVRTSAEVVQMMKTITGVHCDTRAYPGFLLLKSTPIILP